MRGASAVSSSSGGGEVEDSFEGDADVDVEEFEEIGPEALRAMFEDDMEGVEETSAEEEVEAIEAYDADEKGHAGHQDEESAEHGNSHEEDYSGWKENFEPKRSHKNGALKRHTRHNSFLTINI